MDKEATKKILEEIRSKGWKYKVSREKKKKKSSEVWETEVRLGVDRGTVLGT